MRVSRLCWCSASRRLASAMLLPMDLRMSRLDPYKEAINSSSVMSAPLWCSPGMTETSFLRVSLSSSSDLACAVRSMASSMSRFPSVFLRMICSTMEL
jgi:hypothetical protein